MKIAFFIDSLGFGGAEKSLLALLQNLDYTRLEVDLYTLSSECDAAGILSLLPKEVNHRYISKSRHWWLVRLCQLDYSLRIRLLPKLGLKKHLAQVFWCSMHRAFPTIEETYDVAIGYMQGFSTYFVADKVKAKKKLAWINSQLDAHDHEVKFSRAYYDRYDHVVAVSDILNRLLIDKGYVDGEKLSVIYDIIDADDVRLRALEPCDIDRSHTFTIATVARLSREKNLTLAIEAAKILQDKGVDFIWYVVGEGEMHQALDLQIASNNLADRVILTGPKFNPYPYMRAADIYVQTSKAEGFGITIAEAKILCRPVVSTNFPLVYIQIKDGVNGLVAEMTPESLSGKILQLMGDAPLRNSIAEKLRHEENRTKYTETQKFMRLIGLK